MEHRISAGALVVQASKVLMVRHFKEGAYDCWVPPGGGVIGKESLQEAAKREALEETGLIVEPKKLAYVEELVSVSQRIVKFWFFCELVGGTITYEQEEAKREFIVDARFLSVEEMKGKTIFPPVLENVFWDDLKAGFPETKYLSIREMAF